MSGLAISELGLSHFRSHRRASLTWDGRPVAIHGPNGTGKTNLIEAISLLTPGRGLRRAATDDLIARPDGPGWKVTATIRTDDGIREVETWATPGSARFVRIDGKAAPQLALARIVPVLWLVPAMDRLWIEGADGRRRFLDRATLSFVPAHGEAVLDYEKAMRERNRLLKDMVRDPHWYTALELQMARSGITIEANRRAAITALTAAQVRAETSFPVADLDLIHPDTDLPMSEPELCEAYAAGRSRDMAAGRTLIGPHRSDLSTIWQTKGMPAADCSTGEQKALLISLILANARALAGQTAAPPVLLLDEVAAHLDAGRRASLYDEICALDAQTFMTGTGSELFADLRERAQYVEVTEVNGTSTLTERTVP
jgi:DNA replication and repair protein RecF